MRFKPADRESHHCQRAALANARGARLAILTVVLLMMGLQLCHSAGDLTQGYSSTPSVDDRQVVFAAWPAGADGHLLYHTGITTGAIRASARCRPTRCCCHAAEPGQHPARQAHLGAELYFRAHLCAVPMAACVHLRGVSPRDMLRP